MVKTDQTKEVIQAVQAYMVHMYHNDEECKGLLEFTGESYPVNPPSYRHRCQKCGMFKNFKTIYPTVRYAPIIGANSNQGSG